MGHAPDNVPAYSSDYSSLTLWQIVTVPFGGLKHTSGSTFYGMKWQCVEFARRWLILARGVTFGDVPVAYKIFDMTHATRVKDNASLPFDCVPNGSDASHKRPTTGCILIWNEGGLYRGTGRH